jgi:hypothetical protein
MKTPDKVIENAARTCAVTGKTFETGDTILSYLLDDLSEYRRVDLLAEAADRYTPPRLVICRWKWTVKARDTREKEAALNQLAETEAMFLALCEESEPQDGDPLERAILKHLLALSLQRKRILKAVKGTDGDYIHAETRAAYSAPAPKGMTPEALKNAALKLAAIAP